MFCVANTFWAARVFVRASATRIQSWFFAPMSKLAGLPFFDRWRIGKRVLCFKFQQNHHKFDESVTGAARANRPAAAVAQRSVASFCFCTAPRSARRYWFLAAPRHFPQSLLRKRGAIAVPNVWERRRAGNDGHTKGRGVYCRPDYKTRRTPLNRPASCNSQVTKRLLMKYLCSMLQYYVMA